jgi:hypothetical protein
MKQLIWKLVMPVTILSFTVFTKSWYVLPVDAPESTMIGFPFPYACEGWHTSLSLQIFVIEFLCDLLTYFLFWLGVVYVIHHWVQKIIVPKQVTIILLVVMMPGVIGFALVANNPDNIYTLKRNFEMNILSTGYKLIWQQNKHRKESVVYRRPNKP